MTETPHNSPSPETMLAAAPFPWGDPAEKIRFSPEGKHTPEFPPGFPFLLYPLSFPEGLRLAPSYHDYFEITYIHHGAGVFHVEDKDYPVETGDVFVIDNTEFHWLESRDPERMKVIAIYFLPELIYRPGGDPLAFDLLRPFLDRRIAFPHRIAAADLRNDRIVDLIARMFTEANEQSEFHQLAIKNALSDILLSLLRYYKTHTRPARNGARARRDDFERLRTVIQFLQQNFGTKIALADAARVAGMSACYFCKFFKRNAGMTFTNFLLRTRIDKAKELLIQSPKTVIEIAFDVGFENHSYFDRIFKRFVQCSPTQFRKRSLTEPSEIA